MAGIGIIGCGNISTAYLKLAPEFRGLEVRAVADINPAVAEAQATAFGVRAETVDGLLAAPDIDAVINLTIPAVHYEVTTRILNAGKHAYSEKPLCLSLQEGESLRALSARTGKRVGCAPDTFLGGAHQQARAAIDGGQIGKVLGGTAYFMGHGMEGWHPNPDFFFAPGGGPVLDMGPYYITNLVQLLGPVKAVTAVAKAGFPTRTIANGPRDGEVLNVTTATDVQSILEFHSGAAVAFGTSWDVWKHRHENMELYGETGSIYIPDPNFFGGPVHITERDGDAAPVNPWDHAFAVDNMQDHLGRPMANWRGLGLADMMQAVEQGRPHRCSLELAIHVVDAMTSILRAGEAREWVTLTTTCERPAPLGPEEARSLKA